MVLINRLQPYNLESLSGYMERLRKANYYEEPKWYLDFFSEKSRYPLDYLHTTESYTALSNMTGLSSQQIYNMTVHRFSNAYSYKDEEGEFWSLSGLRTYIHGTRVQKICPLCWCDYRTLFIPWKARQVTTSPQKYYDL